MHNPSPATPAVLRHVSSNLRRYRQAAGLSQEALATAAGVSRRMLVGIESGETNVSLGVLDRIAASLNVAFTDLVRVPGTADDPVIAEVAWVGAKPCSQATLLASAPARSRVELWLWQLGAGEIYQSEPDPQGWHEMLHVIEGALTLVTDSGNRVLVSGESFGFASNQRYAYRNDGEATVRFIRNVAM